jgi:O-antigen/teichoic acid export membrane protein
MMLKRRPLDAAAWSGADLLVRQGLQFLAMLVLARLVAPDDFGTVAVLGVFVAIGAVLVDGGLSTALIQRRDIDHTDESTVFWLNAVVGLTLGSSLVLAAGPLSDFFAQPALRRLTLAAALTVIVSALGAVHTALLVRKLDFRTQLYAGAAAAVLSGALSISMALNGFGAWALAAQMLGMASLSTVFLWLMHRWRPAPVLSLASAKKLLGFGGFVLVANLIDALYTHLYAVLIGRYIGLQQLGYYERADSTKQLPASLLTGVFGRVTFPLLSKAARDPIELRHGIRMAIRGLMLINLPMMLGSAALAETLIVTVFGEVWRPAVMPFQILCIAAALWPMHMVNVNALLAQGHARLVLKLEMPKKILGLAMLIIGMFFGIEGVAWSQVTFSIMALWINSHYTNRLVGYGLVHQLKDIVMPGVVATVMAGALYSLALILVMNDSLKLISLTVLGGVFYITVIFLAKPPALLEIISIWRTRHTGDGTISERFIE